jgi:ABC-type Fe3+/spermidine/putrescine transport system ATPase subunit
MLKLANLRKRFGDVDALAGVDLDVERGERVALFGPSGCGKTTLLRLIAGLDGADEGTIWIDGKVVSGPAVRVAPSRRGIGMVFQDLGLWPHMSAVANVEFMVARGAGNRKWRVEMARQMLDLVRLGRAASRYPHELSGGERQRLALARAIASSPKLLLMDEPFSSVELELKIELMALVQDVVSERAITLVYVSHSADEVEVLADRVATMERGRIVDIVPVARGRRDDTARA